MGAVAATASFIELPLRSEDRLRPQDAERALPAFGVRPVDDEHAVEVVELVLRDARAQPGELPADIRALDVLPLERHTRRPLDRDPHSLEREAALVVRLRRIAALDDPRVHDRPRAGVVGLEDE